MTTPPDAAEEPWAASRDASWYARPNVRSVKVRHVAGKPCREGTLSRCGRSVLDDGLTWNLNDVPADLRCQASGCRQAWPTTTALEGR